MIEATREYLFTIIDKLLSDNTSMINANFLDDKINSFSIVRIPVEKNVSKWITPTFIKQEIYSFQSRKSYSADVSNNLKNIGFFEQFEEIIEENNRKGILPLIKGIQSIECLNCGSVDRVNTKDCVMSIQVKIEYLKEYDNAS